MNPDSHQRARQLILAACVEGIASGERDWLQEHLTSCRQCSKEAAALDTAVGSLRALPVASSPDLVNRTKRAVRRRAEQLRTDRPHTAPLLIVAALSAICMVVTAPYVWRAFGWFGRSAEIPDPVWQSAFLVWWFLPATLLALAAAWKSAAKEIHWGHQWQRKLESQRSS